MMTAATPPLFPEYPVGSAPGSSPSPELSHAARLCYDLASEFESLYRVFLGQFAQRHGDRDTMSDAPAEHRHRPLYEHIYTLVHCIPPGRVASYGQIAALVGACTPRMVGYAMAAVAPATNVPWHRVINAQGKISLRADGGGAQEQRFRLEQEGVTFDSQHRVNWRMVRWEGPSLEWLLENGYDPAPA